MEVPSHRACSHCRSQKVRCIVDEDKPEICQRCAKAGKTCVFTPLQKRKQRKRTDTRVAELEREMRAMRAALQKKDQSTNGSGHSKESTDNTTAPRASGVWFEENSQHGPITHELGASSIAQASMATSHLPPPAYAGRQEGAPSLWPSRFADAPNNELKDVVDSGLISMATARQLFETYRTSISCTYPIVIIPESTTADEVRRSKPALFLAAIAAAAGKDNAELSAMLDKEVLHAYATRHVVNSEKSLELVQALLISAVWYHPPTKFGQLKYYEYIHMAATMAMDIGIGTRPVPHRSRFNPRSSREPRMMDIHPLEDANNPDLSMTPRSRDQSPDTGSFESRRTFLACFIVCSGVSMSLRRPSMLRSSSYVRECVEILERSSSEPSDRTLAAWVRLIMLAEEICTSFSFDDPGDIACITHMKTHYMLKDYEKRLSAWYTNTPVIDMTDGLAIAYYSIRIYLHEIALHVDHSPEDFKAPFQMGPVHPWQGDEVPTQILAESIAECVTGAHALLNAFLNVDPETGRCLPVFVYVRVSFAAFVLAKLCLSAAHPGSRIGQVLDRSSLKVEDFIDRAILHVRAIVGPVRCRVPAIFLALLFKLRQWCMNPLMIESSHDQPTASAAIDVGQEAAQSSNGMQPRAAYQTNSLQASTPQSRGGATEQKYNNIADYAATVTAGALTPPPQVGDSIQTTAAVSIPVDGLQAPSIANTAAGLDTTGMLPFSIDAMELDPGFFQFLGDINALGGGGLTGLDDWSTMLPTGYDSSANGGIDWSMPGAGGGTTAT